MKIYIKWLLNDSIIYGLSGVISTFISIFLIPLYTRVFEPADYGVISIMTTTSAFLTILLIFSLDNSAAVWFWDNSNSEDRKKTFNSWIGFLAMAGGVIAILLSVLSRPLSILFFETTDYAVLFILLAINLLFAGFQKVVNIWCRMLQQPVRAMLFSIALLLVTVGLNIYFILYLRIGVSGVFYSQLIASVAGALLMIIMFRQWIQLSSFSKQRVREMIRFSAPLVPATILYWLMNTASVYFLKAYVKDNAEIGLYQVGASVANILSLITWAFFQAWTPFALSVTKQENAGRIYSFIFELYCVAGFFIALSLMLTSADILLIFTHSGYLGAATVLGLLAINVVLVGMPNILAIANNLVKKNNSYAVAIAIGSVVTVLLFMVLIPRFGKEGAALSMIAGNLVIPVFLGYKAQKLYYIPYNFLRIALVVALLFIVFYIAGYYVKYSLFYHIVIIVLAFLLVSSYYYQQFKKNRFFVKV
jgi:O-antigen/teichoic acid export membrane protein